MRLWKMSTLKTILRHEFPVAQVYVQILCDGVGQRTLALATCYREDPVNFDKRRTTHDKMKETNFQVYVTAAFATVSPLSLSRSFYHKVACKNGYLFHKEYRIHFYSRLFL